MNCELQKRIGKLVVCGGGKMGEGIVAGLLAVDGYDNAGITVINPGLEKRERLSSLYGVRCVADAGEALPADLLILAVKPQVLRGVALELAAIPSIEQTLIVSIAAGVETATLENIFPLSCPVVRAMPNMPLICGAGMTTVSAGSRVDEAQVTLVRDLFASMGDACLIDESLQAVSCSINGSGPAYFALIVEALAKAGEEQGLTLADARKLALQTMAGTARQLTTLNMSPNDLIEKVSSPAGTTIAALDAMREAGLAVALEAGVRAAINRSRELAN